jgi:hypothetical protein
MGLVKFESLEMDKKGHIETFQFLVPIVNQKGYTFHTLNN